MHPLIININKQLSPTQELCLQAKAAWKLTPDSQGLAAPHTPSLCLGLILAIPRVWSLMLPGDEGISDFGGEGGVDDFPK